VLAVHEAAHAVLYVRAGGHVERVSIEPRSGVWVSSPGYGAPRHAGMPTGVALPIHVAGEATTYVQSRRSARTARSGDRDAAGALALWASDGDDLEAARLVDAAWRSAHEALA
jgi:hypothetical protein